MDDVARRQGVAHHGEGERSGAAAAKVRRLRHAEHARCFRRRPHPRRAIGAGERFVVAQRHELFSRQRFHALAQRHQLLGKALRHGLLPRPCAYARCGTSASRITNASSAAEAASK